MALRSLPLALTLACSPAVSFFLPSTQLRPEAPLRKHVTKAAASSDPRGHFTSMELRFEPLRHPFSLLPATRAHRSRSSPLRSKAEQASAENTAVSERLIEEQFPDFILNDGVSYWVYPAKKSNIWLVGVVHGTTSGVKLVEDVIRSIRPEVVMVELDSDRISVLPPGEAMETRSGLWWWSPEAHPEESADEMDDDGADEPDLEDDKVDAEDESAQSMGEIQAAVREAQACGARVLLGDRDFETTARLLEKAKVSDMASAKEREEFNELTISFDCEESTREITRKECEQIKQKAPKVFSVMCTQRDQVMAKNLMKLRGSQTTVAVLGMAHLDGIEKVLKGSGWKRRRPKVLVSE